MSHILVTGGAGFIGSNFVRRRLSRHSQDRVIVLDALTYAGNVSSLEGIANVELIHASIEDTGLVERLLKTYEISTLIHFAAESHVDRSIEGPDRFMQTNILGTHSLLKAARSVWLSGSGIDHRFHHVSTDEVFGTLGPWDPAFSESSAHAPNSPYAASKAASDHLVRAYHHTFGLQTSVTHCSNNYGPFQFPEKLIPLFLLNALQGRALPIYGDGKQVRDWLFVDDHCDAIELVLGKGLAGETYNVGSSEELSNLEVADMLCQLIDEAFSETPDLALRFPEAPPARGRATKSLQTFVKDRPGHDRRYAIDARKITQNLGFQPATSFQSGLRLTLNWYLRHENWWRAFLANLGVAGR
jgi:dTDP-glucose 4,6-dehydratase